MQLPFLKNKLPRVAKEAPAEKMVNGSPEDHVEDHCIAELIDACEAKDVRKFRQALEALLLNSFDWDGDKDEMP